MYFFSNNRRLVLKRIIFGVWILTLFPVDVPAQGQGAGSIRFEGTSYPLYPLTMKHLPQALPSPYRNGEGVELITAITAEGAIAIVPVTANKDYQRIVDGEDFPTLARTGLHSSVELAQTRLITGRSVAEITELARPGRLSDAGFLNENEDIVSVLTADDEQVRRLGLTHPAMARPLFHILNLIETDLALGRWNMARHSWENITGIRYNGRRVLLEAHDTKGGQLSPFDDGITGAFHILIRTELLPGEEAFLEAHYGHLPPQAMEELKAKLTRMETGEMQPQYIMRYGFYEGHTQWRTGPVPIAFIFGLRTLEEIEDAFPGSLYEVLTAQYIPR